MVEELRQGILRLVADHDGEWYWYQLDRALAGIYPEVSTALLPAVRELTAAGLIDIRPNLAFGNIPRYWLTDAGREAAAKQGRGDPDAAEPTR